MGPFAPAAHRSSSVVVLRHERWQQYRIVVSLSTRRSTEVLEVDATHGGGGALVLAANHVFPDEASALEAQEQSGFYPIVRGSALIGYVAAASQAGVLVATRVFPSAVLPGGHAIHAVQEAQWVMLALDGLLSLEEERFWASIQQHTIAGTHYYCETADVTRPFPSSYSPSEPRPEFIWNAWMMQPLVTLGLPYHCPALLQGAAETADQVHPTGQRYSYGMLSRRSRRHPGTRYNARGLNDLAGPGNEIEAELIVWTPSAGAGGRSFDVMRQRDAATSLEDAAVRWARFAWRRGTVPIRWGVELQPLNKGLQAEVYVRDKGPYHGTLTYFRTLQQQCLQDACGSSNRKAVDMVTPPQNLASDKVSTSTGGTDVGSKASPQSNASPSMSPEGEDERRRAPGAVVCINLLHSHPNKRAELMLSDHFQEGMLHVRERLKDAAKRAAASIGGVISPAAEGSAKAPEPRLLIFDWHGTMGKLGEERGIEAFWEFIKQPVQQAGLALGEMIEAQQSPCSGNGGADIDAAKSEVQSTVEKHQDVTPWGSRWRMKWLRRQRGLLRFNCADSLDRTNAATCFGSLPVLQEGLRLLGIPLDITSRSAEAALLSRSPLRSRIGASASSGALSSGSVDATDTREEGTTNEQGVSAILPPQLRAGDGPTPTRSGGGSHLPENVHAVVEVLPHGWERTEYGGRALYVDHTNRKTQWDPPAGTVMRRIASAPTSILNKGASTSTLAATSKPTISSSPSPSNIRPISAQIGQEWEFFSYSLDDVRMRLFPEAVADFVGMFRRHGDVHSALYTGSPAMHSHVLGLVLNPDARPYGGASAGVGKLQNLRVAVQRRWNNTVSDAARQASIEVFLGINVEKHCPGVVLPFNPALCDLQGPDDDDVEEAAEKEEEERVHQGADLEGLHMLKHDGRLGLTEYLTDLEPLSMEEFEERGERGAVAGEFQQKGGFDSEDDSEEEEGAFDPLGAVKRPGSRAMEDGTKNGRGEQRPAADMEGRIRMTDLLL
jgi:hypothetical protein